MSLTFAPVIHPVLLAMLLAVPLALFAASVIRRPYERGRVKIAECAVAVLISLCLLAMGLRPAVPEQVADESDSASRDVDVIFVLDTTMSMWAKDAPDGSTRMSLAKQNCSDIMDKLPGADFSMIRFDDAARVVAPFTKDSETILDLFEIISRPESFMSRGSNMATPKSQLMSFITKASQTRSDDLVLFFMTDGEQTNDAGAASYSDMASYISGGAVIGYGTAEGGKMEDETGTVKDPESGQDGLSKIDEEMLGRIAGELGLSYAHSTDKAKIDEIAGGIADKSGLSTDSEKRERTVSSDIYWMFAPVLAAALVAEMILVVRRRKTELS